MIIAIGQRAPDPGIGSAGDLSVPPLPSPPAPDPSVIEQLTAAIGPGGWITLIVVATVFALVVTVGGIVLAALVLARRGRNQSDVADHDEDDQVDDRRVIKKSLRRAVNAAFGLFVFSSATSMVGTIYALAPLIGDDLGLWAFVIALAGGLEAAMIVFFNLARVRILEDGKAGVEGFAPWAFAAVIGSVNFYEVMVGSNHWGWATARTTLPFGTAFIISRILAYYRRRWLKARKSQQADAHGAVTDTPNPLRTLWTKALTWLGLDGGQNIADSSFVYRRRIIRLARLEFKLANLPADTSQLAPELARRIEARRQRWQARSTRKLAKLLARYGAQVTADISRYLAIFHQAKAQLSADVVAAHQVWGAVVGTGTGEVPTTGTGTGEVPTTGTGTGEVPATGTGTGEVPAPSTAGQVPTPGTGTTQTPAGGTGTAETPKSGSGTGEESDPSTGTSKPNGAMEWAEVRQTRKYWTSPEYAARRADPVVAREYATARAKEVLAATGGNKTAAMREFFLNMVAADWRAKQAADCTPDRDGFNGRHLRAAAGEDADGNGYGRRMIRQWFDQLGVAPEEFADFEHEINTVGQSATAPGGTQ